MIRVIKISIALMFFLNVLNAQDTLVLKNNSKVLVKIVKVEENAIKYNNYFELDGPTLTIDKVAVDHILYSEGYEQKISTNTNNSPITEESPKDLYFRGQKDANQFYQGYKPAGTGTLVVSLLSPLVGLIPATACSVTPPKQRNLEYPDSRLFEKTDYQNGYMKQAKKIKSRKVWTNWGVAFGVNVMLVLFMQNQ